METAKNPTEFLAIFRCMITVENCVWYGGQNAKGCSIQRKFSYLFFRRF